MTWPRLVSPAKLCLECVSYHTDLCLWAQGLFPHNILQVLKLKENHVKKTKIEKFNRSQRVTGPSNVPWPLSNSSPGLPSQAPSLTSCLLSFLPSAYSFPSISFWSWNDFFMRNYLHDASSEIVLVILGPVPVAYCLPSTFQPDAIPSSQADTALLLSSRPWSAGPHCLPGKTSIQPCTSASWSRAASCFYRRRSSPGPIY